MKNNAKVIIFYVVLIAAIFLAIYAMMGSPSAKKDLTFSDVMEYFEEDRVKQFEISSENVLKMKVYKVDKEGVLTPDDVKDAKTEDITYKLYSVELFHDEFKAYKNNANLVDYEYKPVTYPWLLTLIINVVPILLLGFVFFIRPIKKE